MPRRMLSRAAETSGDDHLLRRVAEAGERGRGDGVRRGGGRDLAGCRAADTVGDQRQVGPDEAGVLVGRAHATGVADSGPREPQHDVQYTGMRPPSQSEPCAWTAAGTADALPSAP